MYKNLNSLLTLQAIIKNGFSPALIFGGGERTEELKKIHILHSKYDLFAKVLIQEIKE
jgi:hypothetical protein